MTANKVVQNSTHELIAHPFTVIRYWWHHGFTVVVLITHKYQIYTTVTIKTSRERPRPKALPWSLVFVIHYTGL